MFHCLVKLSILFFSSLTLNLISPITIAKVINGIAFNHQYEDNSTLHESINSVISKGSKIHSRFSQELAYAENDNILLLSELTTSYEYDARGRLIAIEGANGDTVSYVLDQAGNRTNVTSLKVGPPEITSFSAPSSAAPNALITISWVATNATYCNISMSDGSLQGPPT